MMANLFQDFKLYGEGGDPHYVNAGNSCIINVLLTLH